MRKAGKFVAVVLLVASVHTAALALLYGRFEGDTWVILSGPVRFNLVHVSDRGAAFSLFADSFTQRTRVFVVFINLLLVLALSVLFLSLVDQRHTTQLIALGSIVSPGFVGAAEKLLRGYRVDYLSVGFGRYWWPAFNAADLAGLCGWVLLYGLVILRFFRRLPEPSDPRTESGVHDPFYERRRPLRVLVGLAVGLGILEVLRWSAYLLALAMLPSPNSEDAFAQAQARNPSTGGLYLVLNIFILVLIIGIWRAIPKRPIDVLFLRSFRTDKAGWSAVRGLRRSLRSRFRLTGVVDPRESRRLVYLLYWIYMPFVFGIGDMGRVNAFRHNIFLTENWKDDLRRQFPAVRYAIIDCREMTANVAWEVGVALDLLGSHRVFFLTRNGAPAIQEQLRTHHLLASIDQAHCFPVMGWSQLAQVLLTESKRA